MPLSKAPASPALDAPKKETAKITLPPAARSVPQATVNLKTPQAGSLAPSAGVKQAAPTSLQQAAPTAPSSDPNIILGIAAAIVAFASLGMQVWTMLG